MLCFKVFHLQNFRNKRLPFLCLFSLGIYFDQKTLPILAYIYEMFSFTVFVSNILTNMFVYFCLNFAYSFL